MENKSSIENIEDLIRGINMSTSENRRIEVSANEMLTCSDEHFNLIYNSDNFIVIAGMEQMAQIRERAEKLQPTVYPPNPLNINHYPYFNFKTPITPTPMRLGR